MYRIYNLKSSENVEVSGELGPFTVIVHRQNLEQPALAESRTLPVFTKRQLICNLSGMDILIAQGMMQWMVGDCRMVVDARGLFGHLGKKGRPKGGSFAPCYSGNGTVVLEPVEDDILLVDLNEWREGIVLNPGLFLACTADVIQSSAGRTALSAALPAESGVSMVLSGTGFAALKTPCLKETLVLVELEEDVLRIHGNFAVAWSSTLSFGVESAGKSAGSSEGAVNIYSGTGKILLAPIVSKISDSAPQSIKS